MRGITPTGAGGIQPASSGSSSTALATRLPLRRLAVTVAPGCNLSRRLTV